jgi:hypothetical protein
MTETEHKPGPFGGLSASEAGRKSWDSRRQRKAEEEAAAAEGPSEDESNENLRRIARGQGPGAVAAVKYLDERRARQTDATKDKPLLAMLCPTTRHLIAAELRLGELPEDLLQVIESELTERELVPTRWPHEHTS